MTRLHHREGLTGCGSSKILSVKSTITEYLQYGLAWTYGAVMSHSPTVMLPFQLSCLDKYG